MIKKRNLTNGVNANVSLEPSAASQSNNNLTNNIYITKRNDGKEDIIITRDVLQPSKFEAEETEPKDVKYIILESYAKMLLSQDRTLLANLIYKNNTIIIPVTSLEEIIKVIVPNSEVEIHLDEDIHCCALKANPVRKIEAIKIIKDDGEICTDFKQVYNKEYNQLVNVYHVCLKYAVLL